jgi:hypothetical protein
LNQSNQFVEVYIAKGEAEAQIIKGLLESYGIPSIFKAQVSPAVHVFAVDGMGQVSILVKPEDAETAKELVKGENNA